MFYYTYVLESQVDNKYYVGWTSDLKKRFQTHNEGLVVSTRFRRPFQLIYYEACKDKSRAIAREKYFKSGFGRRFLRNRI
jgi:putative endonuclease